MALLLRNGAVFLHVPKTGGTWVTEALGEQGLVDCYISFRHADMERVVHLARHRPLRYLKKIGRLGPGWQRRVQAGFKFCFVRNPLDWYSSWWRYMTKRGWNEWGREEVTGRWHPNAWLDGLGAREFEDFVRNVAAARPGYVSEMFGWYATPDIDFIGRQEHLVDDLVEALRRMNVTFDETRLREHPAANVTSAQDSGGSAEAGAFTSPALREELERLEWTGLVRYGYRPCEVAEPAPQLAGRSGRTILTPTPNRSRGIGVPSAR